jgi:hypothetical protein
MYIYSLPSSWYVTIQNNSRSNRDTITIPVNEEEYNIITRQYVKDPLNELTVWCAISGPYIILDKVYNYFYHGKSLPNAIETIKMFAWLNCINAIKQFDYTNILIGKNILLCALMHANRELFNWAIEHIDKSVIEDFYNKNIKNINQMIFWHKPFTNKNIFSDSETKFMELFEHIEKNYYDETIRNPLLLLTLQI